MSAEEDHTEVLLVGEQQDLPNKALHSICFQWFKTELENVIPGRNLAFKWYTWDGWAFFLNTI